MISSSSSAGVEEGVELNDEEQDAEEPGTLGGQRQQAVGRSQGEEDGGAEAGLQTADQMIDGSGDGGQHDQDVAEYPDEAVAAEALEEQKVEEPTVGRPGPACSEAGEVVGMRDGVVGEDPLAGKHVPPDVSFAGYARAHVHEDEDCREGQHKADDKSVDEPDMERQPWNGAELCGV